MSVIELLAASRAAKALALAAAALPASELDSRGLSNGFGLRPEKYWLAIDADHTASFTRMFDAAVDNDTIWLTPGRAYTIDALIIPNKRLTIEMNGATITKKAGASNTEFLVASANWYNSSTSAGLPIKIRNGSLNGNGQCTVGVLVGNNYFSEYDRLYISGSAADGFVMSTRGRDGATIVSSTIVNNSISSCRFYGNAGNGFRLIDPTQNRLTDLIIQGFNRAYGNGAWGFQFDSSAGLDFSGVQTYANASGGVWHKVVGQGFRHHGCYHDDAPYGVQVDEVFAEGSISNTVFKNCRLNVTFGSGTGSNIQKFFSKGNLYYPTGASNVYGIRHGFFQSTKVIFSEGDTFGTATGNTSDPVAWHQNTSPGQIVCTRSYSRLYNRHLHGLQRLVSANYRPRTWEQGDAIPTSGTTPYDQGSVVEFNDPASAGAAIAICTVRGFPGSWQKFGGPVA